jgi:hypothetical protein
MMTILMQLIHLRIYRAKINGQTMTKNVTSLEKHVKFNCKNKNMPGIFIF